MSQQPWRPTIAESGHAIVVGSPDGAAHAATPGWESLARQDQTSWTGFGWFEVLGPSLAQTERVRFAHTLASGRPYQADWTITAPRTGARVLSINALPSTCDGAAAFSALAIDVTAERARLELLVHRATHDALTGLLDRAEFTLRVNGFLGHDQPGTGAAAFVFVDVDDLSVVNDRFGHLAGDDAMKSVADLIAATIGPDDLAARYGGGTFIIFCPRLGTFGDAADLAGRIDVAVREDLSLPMPITVSTGCGAVLATDRHAHEILDRTDAAIYDTRATLAQASERTGRPPAITTPDVDPIRMPSLRLFAGAVQVRNRFDGRWSDGFEISEIVVHEYESRYRVRRRSDASMLPGDFGHAELRPTEFPAALARAHVVGSFAAEAIADLETLMGGRYDFGIDLQEASHAACVVLATLENMARTTQRTPPSKPRQSRPCDEGPATNAVAR